MNTVLNIALNSAEEIKKQPIFLGKSMGLQRYDILKYPVFDQLWKKQMEYIWVPEEITLKDDRNKFENLTPTQEKVFKKNLSFQTMGDSMFSRSIELIKSHVTNTELEAAMSVWSMSEVIHSRSYSYVLNNISRDPNKFFDDILQDEEVVVRAKSMKESFDSLLGKPESDKDLKEKLFKSILNFQIAEGITFYVSFACSFWFGSQGIMTGNADIIRLIQRDEGQHQAITQNILSIWKDNKDEGFQDILKENEQLIYDTFGVAVENEKRWAEYLFSDGSLIGLNSAILGKYSEWLANNRLRSLGYKKIFDVDSNPIGGWINQYVDSSRVQVAPQERTQTNYKKSAITSDLDGIEDFKF